MASKYASDGLKYPNAGCSRRAFTSSIIDGAVGKFMSATHIGIRSNPSFGPPGANPPAGTLPGRSTAMASLPRRSIMDVKSYFMLVNLLVFAVVSSLANASAFIIIPQSSRYAVQVTDRYFPMSSETYSFSWIKADLSIVRMRYPCHRLNHISMSGNYDFMILPVFFQNCFHPLPDILR